MKEQMEKAKAQARVRINLDNALYNMEQTTRGVWALNRFGVPPGVVETLDEIATLMTALKVWILDEEKKLSAMEEEA